MNMCSDPDVLRIMLIMKIVYNIVTIILPILLIIITTIDCSTCIINPEKLKELFPKISRRFIAALVVFFVPTIIFGIISYATEQDFDYNKTLCINEATVENINKLVEVKKAETLKEKEQRQKELAEARPKPVPPVSNPIPNNNNNNGNNNSGGNSNVGSTSPIASSSRMTPFVNGVQKALDKGECMSASDNCACPTVGQFSGFYFTMESETGRNMSSVQRTGDEKMVQVKVQCSDGSYISKTVNSKIKSNFEAAFNRLCQLRTTGINGVKISSEYLRIDGTLNERTTSSRTICSPHAYGIAIDINYDLVININGIDYKPYASQGARTKRNYDQFVSIIGGENNPMNVNYMLWIHVFQPSGFTWGGNWSEGSFDPMHYEVAL